MLAGTTTNRSIICVDDEEGMRDSYRAILCPAADPFSDIWLMDGTDESVSGKCDGVNYDLWIAASGAEAVETVRQQAKRGHRFAAGFFDMRMPGMDGYETIRQVRAIDQDLICAVVTAYTDRKVEQIRGLFGGKRQDELLYFKKPFAAVELEQSAFNMISAWNRKRSEDEYLRVIEKNRQGLKCIIHAMAELSSVPPRTMKHLLSGVLYYFLSLVDSDGGFIATMSDQGDVLASAGLGSFENARIEDLIRDDANVRRALGSQDKVIIAEQACLIPLRFGTRDLGLVYVDRTGANTVASDLELLEIMRTQSVTMILNSILYDQMCRKDEEALIDPLTGLFNRRFIDNRLEQEMSRARRRGHPIALMMIDLDHFKQINDSHGHPAGDHVLRSVGEVLRACCRNYDVVGRNVDTETANRSYQIRYGGDEFSIIVPEVDEDAAIGVAERVRAAIESATYDYNGEALSLTASIGIAVHRFADEERSASDFLGELAKGADRALYAAKAKGKNCVELYRPWPGASRARLVSQLR
jgi:two-component system cell cycle response regulator